MGMELRRQSREFVSGRKGEVDEARQMVALRIMCGLDLADVLLGGTAERLSALRGIERLVERERLKGLRRHWSYDLNRHIALKQVCDRLRRSLANDASRQNLNQGLPPVAPDEKRRPKAP